MSPARLMRRVVWLAVSCLVACSKTEPKASGFGDRALNTIPLAERRPMTVDEAKDPAQCKTCHLNQYNEWASSMHAYASKDPVFVAMNKRGQRETNGELGDFCLKCHAPMAVLDAKIDNAADSLTDLPAAYQGVTCYFCHNADSIVGDHNATPHLTNDVTLRGPYKNPKQPVFHRAAYSRVFDDNNTQSNAFCGGCHDIVTPAPDNVHLERTYEEYQASLYADPSGKGAQTCIECHMDAKLNVPIADDTPSEVGARPAAHTHLWPGVDIALTDFPDRDVQRAAVQCSLDNSVITSQLEPNTDVNGRGSPGVFTVALETFAGHAQPSGAAQDRRMWLEILAYDSDNQLLRSSGTIADGEVEEKAADDPTRDPNLQIFRDRVFDKDGQPTDNFWDAAPSTAFPSGYRANVVAPPKDVTVPHVALVPFHVPNLGTGPGQTARIVGHLHMRPIGMDVLQDLVATGDLDPSLPAGMPTFTIGGAEFDWNLTVDGLNPPTPNSARYQCY